jgi:hypothetical protein
MFDHEKLDAYQLEFKFLASATEARVELSEIPRAVNKRDWMNRWSAPKGQQDSAQGFNPGYRFLWRCALKWRQSWSNALNPWIPHDRRTHSGTTFRAHTMGPPYPGLKPWAESYCPFGADEDGLPRRSLRRRDDEYEDDTRGSGSHS